MKLLSLQSSSVGPMSWWWLRLIYDGPGPCPPFALFLFLSVLLIGTLDFFLVEQYFRLYTYIYIYIFNYKKLYVFFLARPPKSLSPRFRTLTGTHGQRSEPLPVPIGSSRTRVCSTTAPPDSLVRMTVPRAGRAKRIKT